MLSIVLVFHYVCLAWIFFRATSFDNALAVLRRLAGGETDHANLVPMVTTALVVGMLCHFFADNTFRWLRQRFVELSPWAQGLLLAAAAMALRELASREARQVHLFPILQGLDPFQRARVPSHHETCPRGVGDPCWLQ